MAEQPFTRPAAHRILLAEKNFTLFFAATSISTLGTALAQTGLSLALFVTGYKASTVGLVLAAETTPMLIFALAGGVLGDRWSRRRLMVAADLLRFSSQGILAISLARGQPPMLALMALGACVGIGNAFYRPAASGLVPQIVARDHLKTANTLTSMSNSLFIVLGPAIGGMLVGFGGGVLAIAADALSYLFSASLLTLVQFPQSQTRPGKTSFWSDLKLGAAAFRGQHWLPLLTVQISLVNAMSLGMFFVLGPSLYAPLKTGPQSWGLVTASVGIGAFAGSLIVLRFSFARPLRTIQFCIAIMTTPLVLLALHAPLALLMLASCGLGIGMAMINTLFQTTLQKTIDMQLLSRVSSIVGLVAMCLIPVGYSLSGPAASVFGARPVVAAGAGLVMLTVLGLLTRPEIIRN